MSGMREPFHSEKVCVARKSFRFSGTLYERGQTFPWKLLDVPERKVHEMYKAHWVSHPVEGAYEVPSSGKDLTVLSYRQLQEECKKYDLMANGTTPQLRERLAVFYEQGQAA